MTSRILLPVLAILVASCEPRRGPDGAPIRPPPPTPGYTCDADHVSEERVRHIATYMHTGDEGVYEFETCLPVHRADGSIYAYEWAAYRAPRNGGSSEKVDR